MAESKKYVAFDIGGSKVSGALISAGKVIRAEKIKTPQSKPEFYKALESLADELRGNDEVAGFAICVAGAMDKSRQVMISSPNLSFLNETEIDNDFKSVFGDNVKIDNDVNCFLRGELHFGSVVGFDPVVALTIGTGVGGAVQVNEDFLSLAEIGHTVIDEVDGEYLTVEDLVSSHGFHRLGIDDPRACEDLAREGDEESIEIYRQVGTHLGTALGNIVNIFQPQMIVLGGSIMHSDYLILDPAKEQMKNISMLPEKYWPEIKISQLANATELGGVSMFVEN